MVVYLYWKVHAYDTTSNSTFSQAYFQKKRPLRRTFIGVSFPGFSLPDYYCIKADHHRTGITYSDICTYTHAYLYAWIFHTCSRTKYIYEKTHEAEYTQTRRIRVASRLQAQSALVCLYSMCVRKFADCVCVCLWSKPTTFWALVRECVGRGLVGIETVREDRKHTCVHEIWGWGRDFRQGANFVFLNSTKRQ